jgi:hypothetical protein
VDSASEGDFPYLLGGYRSGSDGEREVEAVMSE